MSGPASERAFEHVREKSYMSSPVSCTKADMTDSASSGRPVCKKTQLFRGIPRESGRPPVPSLSSVQALPRHLSTSLSLRLQTFSQLQTRLDSKPHLDFNLFQLTPAFEVSSTPQTSTSCLPKLPAHRAKTTPLPKSSRIFSSCSLASRPSPMLFRSTMKS
jgi:hypothetical protein